MRGHLFLVIVLYETFFSLWLRCIASPCSPHMILAKPAVPLGARVASIREADAVGALLGLGQLSVPTSLRTIAQHPQSHLFELPLHLFGVFMDTARLRYVCVNQT